MEQSERPHPDKGTSPAVLRTWTTPEIRELPKLTDLTLDTGAGIPGMGGIGGGGSTVIP